MWMETSVVIAKNPERQRSSMIVIISWAEIIAYVPDMEFSWKYSDNIILYILQ